MIEVENLRRAYGAAIAVDGLTFSLAAGEVVGLVGPNGAGKTSTLRCLAGVIPATSGRIRIGGVDIAQDPVGAKRLLAFVPDEPALFEYLTVEEHLAFVTRLYGVSDGPEKSARLIQEMELSEHSKKLPDQLSRGMKQKLVTACALLHRPRALILDEPLTGLDPAGMRHMKHTILAYAQEGAAVLLSSHLLQLIEELCSRILVIHRGRAVFMGTLDEARGARPELVGRGLEDVFLALTATATGEPAAAG